MATTLSEARKVDEHMSISVRPLGSGEAQLVLAPSGTITGVPLTRAEGSVRVGGMVQAANLLTKVSPEYPALAKAARIQGVVKLDALIDTDGNVVNLKLLSGPAMLVQAAMEAARQWVYKPTFLNDRAVQIQTTIDINFTLAE